ncbi:MAG: HypC/HybG/HupF family hydrogenase formation chaperone [Candidatus Omnitrophota bacterium]
MCYAIPGKVKEIKGNFAIVDYFGEEKKAHNEMRDLVVGDYVYAQGGFVIRKISQKEAQEILSAWKDMFFALQEVDVRLSKLDQKERKVDKKVSRILDRALEGLVPKKEDLLTLMNCDDRPSLELLFQTANFLRQKYHKNSCCVHGILEISNYCKQNCCYCGISVHNKVLKRYRMTHDQIVASAIEAIEVHGFKALVLQSGEDPGYSVEEMAETIREIKQKAPCLIFISFGEVGRDGLKKLYEAGARGLLLRFETSNPKLYQTLHPGRSLETRLEDIRAAFDMGYIIITGGLIGLPEQTNEDIVDGILLARNLHTEMYSFGPFLPHPETPLADKKPIEETTMLKVLACARLVDPKDSRVLITTAFETLSMDARKKGLLAGGSSVMLNVTPVAYREQYDIYPNRMYKQTEIQNQIKETIRLLESLGRAPTDLGAR